MQNQPNTKTCRKCAQLLSLSAFGIRTASCDGRNATCLACVSERNRAKYWNDPVIRQKSKDKAVASKRARFARDPAYKRAFRVWNNTMRKTKAMPWVAIVDFVPVCQEALDKGPGYEIDHIIPLKGALVCGLHVPANVQAIPRAENIKKSNKHASASKL